VSASTARLDARLTIVGEGPEREQLQSLIATLELDGRGDAERLLQRRLELER
jgi:hypothetical protein